MVGDPASAIGSVQAFFDLPQKDAGEVADAVEQRTQVNGKFFWRKKAYNYRQLLPSSSIERFESGFSEQLHALGYFDREAAGGGIVRPSGIGRT